MRLVTYSCHGPARAGVMAGDRVVVDLRLGDEALSSDGQQSDHSPLSTSLVEVIASDSTLTRAGEVADWARAQTARSSELERDGVLFSTDDIRLLPPIPNPSKIICLGRNYAKHAREAGLELPEAPELFAKFANSLVGHGEEIVLPAVSEQVDYEAELAYVIGKTAASVYEEEALDYVAGYTILNDVSIRDYQLQTSQWLAGKSMDRTTPVGPWIVTRDEIPDPQNLAITLEIDGERLQDANTDDMVFSVASSLAFISSVLTLNPGDIVSTGTPDGVGFTREPPRFLRAGDVVNVELEQIGTLSNPVASPAPGREAP